jgi:hypothetical protein
MVKRMSTRLNDVWDMIEDLEPNDRRIIYKRLNEDIKYKLNDILDSVNERVGEDGVSLEEISKEVELVREANYGKN